MRCNGCRVLHQRCSDACVLRPSIEWIDGDQPQENATVFVANFFGRDGLAAFLAAVPRHHCRALFMSLLFEACGRTINPVSGAIGLMWTGNWDLSARPRPTPCCAATPWTRSPPCPPPSRKATWPDSTATWERTNTGSSSSLHSSPENSTSAPASAAGGQQVNLPAPGPVLQSCELDLCLTPLSSPLAGGRRGGASDEYTTTCCEEASGYAAEAGEPATSTKWSICPGFKGSLVPVLKPGQNKRN